MDRAVGIADALAASSRLENTMIVFIGQRHAVGRAPLGQQERSVRGEHPGSAGRAVRRQGPGGAARTDEHLVLNIDLAPTFGAGLADVAAERRRSEPGSAAAVAVLRLANRLPDRAPEPRFGRTADLLRRARQRHKPVRGNGERELYDLHADPLELRNRYDVLKYRPVERELNDA